MTQRTTSPGPEIAVTGVGLVSPLGNDRATAWEGLRLGDNHPTRHEHRLEGELWGDFLLFEVQNFEPRELPLADEARSYAETHDLWSDVDLMYLVATLTEALSDAGIGSERRASDIGLVLTHESPGVDQHVEEILQSFQETRPPHATRREIADALYRDHRDSVYNLQTFMLLHRVARALDLHGQALFVNNACASGLYALDTAALLLQAGRCKAVLVAGSDHPTSYPKYRWFEEQGLMAKDGIMRPFDRRRQGFVLGDGGAALVLETMETARARGARPYAVYRGGGFNQEAWKVAVPNPTSGHYEEVLRKAIADADLKPQDIDWIVPHAVATSVHDAHEARSLTTVFGSDFEHPRLTAFKPYVGHNLGGSGVTETALLLLAMRHGYLPPARGCEHPDPSLHVRPLQEAAQEIPRYTLKCAAGFGGFNAACVFERCE